MGNLSNIDSSKIKNIIINLEKLVSEVANAEISYNPNTFEKFRDRLLKEFNNYIDDIVDRVLSKEKNIFEFEDFKRNLEIEATNIKSTFEQNNKRAFAEAMHGIEQKLKKVMGSSSIFGFSALVRLFRRNKKIEMEELPKGFSRLNKNNRIFSIGLIPYLTMLVVNAQMALKRATEKSKVNALNLDLVRISPEPSWLGPNADEVCNRWRDKIVSMNGLSNSFPSLSVATSEKPPLFHPNCRHTIIALTEREQKIALKNKDKVKSYTDLKKFL